MWQLVLLALFMYWLVRMEWPRNWAAVRNFDHPTLWPIVGMFPEMMNVTSIHGWKPFECLQSTTNRSEVTMISRQWQRTLKSPIVLKGFGRIGVLEEDNALLLTCG